MLDWETAIVSSSGGAIVAVGDDGRIAFASSEACSLLGWPSLVGQPLTAIIPQRLQGAHHAGFGRYVKTGESRLQGKTVRVPARHRDGTEVELDLTIRVFRRPDGSKLVSAALSKAALGRAPPNLKVIEDAFAKRLYELV
jgi:PAS domain S-box-containing protein